MRTFTLCILLLLQAAVYFTTSDDNCGRDPTEYCTDGEGRKPQLQIPSDENNLTIMCRDLLKYIDCLEEYEMPCPDGFIVVFTLPYDSKGNYKIIREVCDNSSKLHIEYTKHISCISSVIRTNTDDCKNISDAKVYEYYTFLEENLRNEKLSIKAIREEYYSSPSCLNNVYTTVCMLPRIKNACNVQAASVSKEIIERSSFPLTGCSARDFKNLETGFLKFLPSSEESSYLKDILSYVLMDFLINEIHSFN